MTYTYGQRVEMMGFGFGGTEVWETAKIVKPPKTSLPKPGDDWHLIEFTDKGRIYVHESRLRTANLQKH